MNDAIFSLQAEAWLQHLQQSGYRVTAPLRAVVGILAATGRPLGAIELYDLGRRQYPNLGLVTVYRTLEKLEALGLVQRVHQPGGCHTYLPAFEGHQHLLFCTHCGRAEVFEGEDLGTFFRQVGERAGFTITDHWLQLFGVCQDCVA